MSLESICESSKRIVSEGVDAVEHHPWLTLGAAGIGLATLLATKGRAASTVMEEFPAADKFAGGVVSGAPEIPGTLNVPILKGPWNEASVSEVGLPGSNYVARVYNASKDAIAGVFKNGERQGTAFFIDRSGLAATNHHVVGLPTAPYELALSDGSKVAARVVAMDPKSDLAILRVLNSERKFPVLPLGSSTAKGLDEVVAVGFPEQAPVATASPGSLIGTELIQSQGGTRAKASFDMVMKAGNSGSPVLDPEGNVIAVLNRYSFREEAFGPSVEHLKAMYSAARQANGSAKYLVLDTGLKGESVADGVGVLRSKLTSRPPIFP